MQLVCPCLNVTINVVVEDEENFLTDATVKPESVQQVCDDEAVEDDFFALCIRGAVARFMLDSEKGIVEVSGLGQMVIFWKERLRGLVLSDRE